MQNHEAMPHGSFFAGCEICWFHCTIACDQLSYFPSFIKLIRFKLESNEMCILSYFYFLGLEVSLNMVRVKYVYCEMDEETRRLYVAREMILHDQATRMYEAKEEGLEEGMKKGREGKKKEKK